MYNSISAQQNYGLHPLQASKAVANFYQYLYWCKQMQYRCQKIYVFNQSDW